MKIKIAFYILATAAISSIGAEASLAYFFSDPAVDRTAFQAASAGPLTLESFEDNYVPADTVSFPVGGPQEFTVASSLAGVIRGQRSISVGVSDGSYAMSFSEDFSPTLTLTFSFDSPINAFGLDVNHLNYANMSFADNLGNLSTDVLLGDNGGPAGGPGFENYQFFGVVNTESFSEVQLTFERIPGTFAFNATVFLDHLEYAVIPEPASIGLLGLISGGIYFARRFFVA